MRLPRLAATFFWVWVVLVWGVGAASSQSGQNCPYGNGGVPTSAGCSVNLAPDPIPSGVGGNPLAGASCANVLIAAIASLFSYDDPGCPKPATRGLKLVTDAADYLPPEERSIAEQANFHGALYCDTGSNVLILALRGSTTLTPFDRTAIADWVNTNTLQHLAIRPWQYRIARDVAWLMERDWRRGAFDKTCGSGRPKIIVTGHSKGGGQAQYAAAQNKLDAVAFNSDPVNPAIFTDWMLTSDAPAIVNWMLAVGHGVGSGLGCQTSQLDHNSQSLAAYLRSGRIKDVRMVNDVIATYVLPHCNFPHAPIDWLVDTLSCSADGSLIESLTRGHQIETVVRELQACAVCSARQPGTKNSACP